MADLNQYQNAVIRMFIQNIAHNMNRARDRFPLMNKTVWHSAVADAMSFECTAEQVAPIWDGVLRNLTREGAKKNVHNIK